MTQETARLVATRTEKIRIQAEPQLPVFDEDLAVGESNCTTEVTFQTRSLFAQLKPLSNYSFSACIRSCSNQTDT